MKRRKAIQNIALISSGIALLPACQLESAPVFTNFSLEPKQWQLIQRLTNTILPKGDLEINTTESTPLFVLRMVNDCYSSKDIQKYISGLKIFQQYIKDEYQTTFDKLNLQQHMLLFSAISESSAFPESLKYFLSTTKRHTVQHFTSSEYFMKNHLDFEFAPGRFHGCVQV